MNWEWKESPNAPVCAVRIQEDVLLWSEKAGTDPDTLHSYQTVADFREFGALWEAPEEIIAALCDALGVENPEWLDWPTIGVDEMIAYVNRGDMVSLRFLVSQSERIDGRDRQGYDPFYRAVRAGRRDVALWLLEQGFPVNRYYHHHRTALMVAVEEREREVVATLLARGADVNARDDWGMSVLARSAMHEGTPLSMVQLLVDAGANDLEGVLVQAVYYSNRRIVEYLRRQGADINGRDAQGWTALEAAFRRAGDHPGMVRNLILAGADLCQQFSDGRTVAHAAAEKGWGKIMQMALDAGIPPDARVPETQFTPLLAAAQNGKNLAAVKALIAAGADVNARASDAYQQETVLMALAGTGDFWDMAETLINAGADIHAEDQYGQTALVYAVERNAKMVAQLLLEKGADPNARVYRTLHLTDTRAGCTVLCRALLKRDGFIARALLRAGARVNDPEPMNYTPLHQAAYSNNATMVQMLLEHGADPKATEAEHGQIPLDYAQDGAVRRLLREASE